MKRIALLITTDGSIHGIRDSIVQTLYKEHGAKAEMVRISEVRSTDRLQYYVEIKKGPHAGEVLSPKHAPQADGGFIGKVKPSEDIAVPEDHYDPSEAKEVWLFNNYEQAVAAEVAYFTCLIAEGHSFFA